MAVVGADVGGGFLPADMLFAGGQRQYKAALALQVGGASDETAGQVAHIFFGTAQHAEPRPAKGLGKSHALTLAGHDVRPHTPGAF